MLDIINFRDHMGMEQKVITAIKAINEIKIG